MSDTYFVRIRGRVHGPMDMTRLQTLAQKGQLSRIHEVSRDSRSWQSASTVPEIFQKRADAVAAKAATIDARRTVAPEPRQAAAAAENPSEPATNVSSQSKVWHYSINGSQYGPASLLELTNLIRSGSIKRDDLVWKQTMAQWGEAGHIPELAGLFQGRGGQRSAGGGQGPATDAVNASPGKRFAAQFLNGLMFFIPVLILLFGFLLSGGLGMLSGEDIVTSIAMILSLAIAGLSFIAIVITNFVMLLKHSQSIGKYWMKIQIVSIEDDRPADAAKTILLRFLVNGFLTTIFSWTLYPIIDPLFVFREDRRCIHDLIAGTRVIDISENA